MRKAIIYLGLIFLLCFSVSCATARAYRYPSGNFMWPRLNPKQIQVLYLKPSVPFEITGEVTGKGAAINTWADVESAMRKAAAKIGGQAIIIVRKREPYVGTYISPSSGEFLVYGNYMYYTYKPGMRYRIRAKKLLGVVIIWR